jgi:hypothetical protein
MTSLFTIMSAKERRQLARRKNLKRLLRITVAICAVVALALARHYAFPPKQLQANEEPRDQNVHHPDLDNRADLVGVELGFMRGATNFVDPGYRDFPNAAQMQFSPPIENDYRTAGNQP